MKSYYKNIDGNITAKSILSDLYSNRYILYEFVKRDLKILYTQSISGPLFYIIFPNWFKNFSDEGLVTLENHDDNFPFLFIKYL